MQALQGRQCQQMGLLAGFVHPVRCTYLLLRKKREKILPAQLEKKTKKERKKEIDR